jgi:N-acetylglucosaminyl-diphospho-decaprenol L-rhamnosyltransferase
VTVDALIVSFNTRELLRETLSTLVDNPPPPTIELRIRVFDNGSSDGSPEMIAVDFPFVDLIRSGRNAGFGAGNNALVGRSDAQYLLLVNSDVRFTEDIVGPLVAGLADDPSAIVASPRLIHIGGDVQYSARRFPSIGFEIAVIIKGKRVGRAVAPWFDSDGLVRAVREIEATDNRVNRHAESIWATCWMLRRSDVATGELFDPTFPMYDEDLDFCRRAAKAGRSLLYLANIELTHFGGASSPTSAHKLQLMTRARRRYYARHHGPLTAYFYAACIPALFRVTRWVERVPKPTWLGSRP